MFKGLGTALITPFLDNQEIDFSSFEKLVDFQTKAGVDYLVIAGTTGEAPTLTCEEINKLVNTSKNISKLPVVVGISGNSTFKVVSEVKHYNKNTNIDGYLISSPYYNKPSQDGIFEHYNELQKNSSKPIVLYNIPGRTASKIEVKTVKKLIDLSSKFVAIKDAVGDFNYSMDLFKTVNNNKFTFLSGDDANIITLMALGYHGGICVSSNQIPSEFKSLINYASSNDFNKAREIHYKCLDLININFIESNPIPVKYIMSKLNYCKNILRLPMIKSSKTNEIDVVIKKYFNIL